MHITSKSTDRALRFGRTDLLLGSAVVNIAVKGSCF